MQIFLLEKEKFLSLAGINSTQWSGKDPDLRRKKNCHSERKRRISLSKYFKYEILHFVQDDRNRQDDKNRKLN